MSKIKAIFITTRPFTSILAGLSMFIILLKDTRFPIWHDALESMPIVLATMIGFILNDIYDYEKDIRANRQRPIAMGILDKGYAYLAALLLTVFAISIEYYLNQFNSLGILAVTLIGVLVYSPISRHIPLIKGLATAGLTLTPIVYASTVLGREVPLFIYSTITIFILGREILLDTKDYPTDLHYGIKTIVAHLGLERSRLAAWSLMFIGIFYYIFQFENLYGIFLSTAALLCLFIACLQDRSNKVRNGGITIFTMFLCILAIPFAL